MNEFVTVETLKPHRNCFGSNELKEKGDVYDADERHASQLVAQKLVKLVPPKA